MTLISTNLKPKSALNKRYNHERPKLYRYKSSCFKLIQYKLKSVHI